ENRGGATGGSRLNRPPFGCSAGNRQTTPTPVTALAGLCAAGRGFAGAEPVGLGAGLEDMGVEGDPVDDGGDQAGSGKTVPHALNGRFVPLGDDLEEQLGALGVDLDVAELVEQQEVQAAVAADHAGQRPLVGGFDELVDQGGGGGVAGPGQRGRP